MSTETSVLSLDLPEQQEQQHIYFEPKFCCDLELIYDGNIHFHVHKCIMATESVYFKELLEVTPSLNVLDLPTVNTIHDLPSTRDTYEQWITLLYQKEPARFEDCVLPKNQEQTNQLLYYAVSALAHYFHCARIEKDLEKIMIQFSSESNISITQLLEDLLLAETYHWKEALEQLQLDVAIHLEDIRAHPEYDRANWLKVKSATREAILEQALKGFFHNTSNV